MEPTYDVFQHLGDRELQSLSQSSYWESKSCLVGTPEAAKPQCCQGNSTKEGNAGFRRLSPWLPKQVRDQQWAHGLRIAQVLLPGCLGTSRTPCKPWNIERQSCGLCLKHLGSYPFMWGSKETCVQDSGSQRIYYSSCFQEWAEASTFELFKATYSRPTSTFFKPS